MPGDFGGKCRALGLADFRPGVADDVATHKAREPKIPPNLIGAVDDILCEAEMPAQALREIGIRLRQFDQKVEQFRQGRTSTAVGRGHTERAEAALFQCFISSSGNLRASSRSTAPARIRWNNGRNRDANWS
jgi:hypothetical protein